MTMLDGILGEFDHEAATSRKLLERVPEDKLSWQPHAKSMSLGRLAGHIAEIPGWAKMLFTQDAFDLGDPKDFKPPVLESHKDLLQLFEDSLIAFRETARGTSDQAMMAPWQLKQADKVMLELPRIAAVRGLVLNHIIHHRGQLTVYLRQLEVPLPSIYGPSADESGGF